MKNQLKHDKVEQSVILCCGSKRCPVIKVKDQNDVQITDDYGQTITISKQQAGLIADALEMLEDQQD